MGRPEAKIGILPGGAVNSCHGARAKTGGPPPRTTWGANGGEGTTVWNPANGRRHRGACPDEYAEAAAILSREEQTAAYYEIIEEQAAVVRKVYRWYPPMN